MSHNPYREMADAMPVGDELERIQERILGTPAGSEVEVSYDEWLKLLYDPEFVRLHERVWRLSGACDLRYRGRTIVILPRDRGPP